MADRLSSLLQELHALIRSTSAQRAREGHSIASDITQICMESLSESELAYCSSVLFKEEGILTFLKNSAGIDEFAVCKEELLHLVESYVCKMGKKFLPYVSPVKDVCVSLFTREKLSRVKMATFGPFIAVVQLCRHSTLKEDLNIEKVVEKYFLACTQPTKHTATVRSGIYQLLGTLAEVFPEKMETYAPRLVMIYLSNLKQEMDSKKSKKPEMLVISGCLKGLAALLVNFPPTDPKVVADIFRYTRKAIDPQVSLARYDVPKGGLTLLARHASLFRGYLTKDHQGVYAVMFKWCNHHNKDMKLAGFDALEAFLQQVAQHIVEGGKGNAASTSVFKTFITTFQELIDAPTTGTREMSVAVRGYGYFAAPCRMLMKDQDVKFMFDQMIKRSEHLFVSSGELLEEKIYHLPSFLTSLASIVNEIVDVTGDFLGSLERLVVLLFEHFPRLGPASRFSAYKAVNILLATLAQRGALLKTLVSNIVYQGLIRTCSHPVSLQGVVTRPVESIAEGITSYNDYVELWFHIMKPQRKEEQAVSQLTADQRQYLYATLYDALIQSVLRVIHKLDLSATLPDKVEDGEQKEAELVVSDPTASLQPTVVKDFQVFINLVDFCRAVLPVVEPHRFRQWVYLFSRDIISMSAKRPLVSGFYKMLATGLTICSKIRYFQSDEGQLMDSHGHELMETDTVEITERGSCFTLYRKFIKEILERLKQYKDDLQASCLLLILSAPKEFVETDINPIVSAVQIALNLGVSYMPLAEAAIGALESWTSQLPAVIFKPHLPAILPCLDAYLQSAAETDLYSEEAKDVVMLRSHSSSRSRGTGKLPIKVLKALKEGMASSETPLHKLRLRIVQFLGSLGGEYNIGLVETTDSQSLESAVAWDTTKHLDFAVPFNDMKLSIYLDPFLPRVTELALSASDRQTKVAACELLHSMTLFLIGKGAIQPEWAKSKSPMIALYKRLFPIIMRLACDVEQVAVQLFRPLVFQIIHWFTGNKMYECPETVVLLEAVMDCVVDSKSGSLRDFGSECVREFLQWSIKQTIPKQLEKRPYNVKSLLLRLQSLSQHPNPFKRLGSAIAFNNIYTIFREEESLIDMFVLELLVNFVYSLRMAHKDDKSLGTQEQCKQVITHLERMVKAKSHVLLKVKKDRRKPRGFREASIGHLIEWLLSQCGRPETEARHICMRLFCSLVPHAFDQETPSSWMRKSLQHLSASYFNKKFEAAGGRGGIWKYDTALTITEVFSLDQIVSWLEDLLAALDCYTWVLGERLLGLVEILSAGKTTDESRLFMALSWFVNGLVLGGIEDAPKLFARHGVGVQEVFTPMEVERYNRVKCTVTVRLFDFLTVCLGGYPADSVKAIPSNFFSQKLCELVVECVLNPSSVGFDVTDVEVAEHLPSKMVQLCSALVRFLKESDCLSVLSNVLFTRLKNDKFLDLVPNIFVDEDVSWKLHQTVSGYRQIHKAGLLQSAWSDKVPFSQLGSFLLDIVLSSVRPEVGSSSPRRLSPSALSTYRELLLLALDVGVESKKLILCLDERTQTVSRGDHTQSVTLGSVFYLTFQSEIDQYIAQQSSSLVPSLLEQADSNPQLVFSIIGGVLEPKDKTARKKLSETVVAALFTNWPKLNCWWGEKSTPDTKRSAVSLLKKALLVDKSSVLKCGASGYNDVFEMYLVLLGDSTTLGFKATVLELLSSFATVAEPDISRLQSSLEQLVANNFPLKSSEFDTGTTAYRDYVSVIDKILSAMVISQSVMLMKIVISFTCRENRHLHEDQILESVVNFAKRVSSDKAKSATDVCYELFCAEGVHRDEVRRAVAERFLVPMLKNVHKLVLVDFFVHHVGHMMETVTAKLGKASADLSCQLNSRVCICEMLMVLYERLTSVELSTPTGQINRSFCQKFGRTVEHGKELTREITKVSNAMKAEDVRGETEHKELRRQYHCAAYNTLVALMCCTQTEMKFYTGFLFKEDLIKHQLLWDNLVDAEKNYQFAAELESPMFRKGRLNAIRQQLRTKEEETLNEQWHAPHYVSSQYLADSSLREDVSQFDFSSLPQIPGGQESQPVSDTGTEGHGESEFFLTQEVVEQDELNQHECMPVILHLVDHMVYNKITPSCDEGTVASAMPPWMACLHKKMTDCTTTINIRLFLARVIINRPKVFQPYAKFWLTPLVEFIISGVLGTSGLNYFIIDLVVTLLSWAPAKLEDQYLASRLVEFLMTYCRHDTRAVLRNNLEVIKSLVESWKGSVSVPSRVIYDNFRGTGPNDLSNRTGIQLLGVVLANDLCPFDDPCLEKDSFFKALALNLSFKYKDVYGGAAAIIGMTMSHLNDHENVKESALHDEVTKKLSALASSGQAADTDRFITCLHLIQEHYPEFSDRFVNKILFLLPNVHGDFKTRCLEIVCSRATEIPNIYVELKAKGFSGMLRHRDEGIQLVALRIVHSVLKNLALSELKAVVPDVLMSASHASVPCREQVYQILIWLFDSLHGQEDVSSDEQGRELLSSVKTQLLKGLADENEALRLEIYSFWSQETRLSSGTVNRLSQLLAVLYSPQTESSFLSYSTNLMLELTSRSPDYSRSMFDYPLSECKFEDKSIDLSWQTRHLLMVPLFAATQSQGDMTQSMASGIRATQQAMDFTPTQQEGSYDWLQPATQSQGISFTIGSGPESQTQSALLFSAPHRRRPGRPVGEGFGTERLQPSDAVDGFQSLRSQSQEVLKLKRRFVKDKTASSTYFAQLEERKKRARRERMRQQKVSRDARVVMYRKYRDGDLPDIQIKHSELIRPLQALADKDSHMARLLFVAIFRAIYSGIDESLVEASAEETHKTLQEQLNAVLDMSVQYFPPFIGAVQDVCVFIQELTLEPAAISTSSLTSHQQGVGIQLLEKQLLRGLSAVVERPAKRMRTEVPASPEMTGAWIELAKLYKSINDYDAVQGIFQSEVGTKDLTKEALEAEGRGDYFTAYLKFKEAYNGDWNDGTPIQEEQDLWESSILSCCSRLLRWTDIEKFSLESGDEKQSMEYIWDDVYRQEVTLPYLLRCKLKQACGKRHDPDLLHFIDKALRDQQHRALLEGYHCEELCLLFIVQDDLDRARYYVDQCLNSFIQEWAAISRLVTSGRSARLQSIQTITEMKEFLDFMSDESHFDTSKHFSQLLSKWHNRLPHPVVDTVDTWNDIIVNRMMMMDKMLACFERLSGSFLDVSGEGEELGVARLQSLVQKECIQLYLKGADSACRQLNYVVARRYLTYTKKLIIEKERVSTDKILGALCIQELAKMHCQCISLDPKPENVCNLVSILHEFDKFGQDEALLHHHQLRRQHCLLKSKMFEHVAVCLAAEGDLIMETLGDKRIAILLLSSNSSKDMSVDMLRQKVFSEGFQLLVAARAAAMQEPVESQQAGMKEALVALAIFCDKALRRQEDEDDSEANPSQGLDLQSYPGIVVESLLDAMHRGSEDAQQRFPRILQLVERYPETQSQLTDKAACVPSWMFIAWINQMVAILDKAEGLSVVDILVRIAKEYPQALCYPFKTSCPSFKFDATDVGARSHRAVNDLKKLLDKPLIEALVTAFERLTEPEFLLKDWQDNEARPLMQQSVKARNATAIRECWQNFYAQCLDVDSWSSQTSGGTMESVEAGDLHRDFVKNYALDLEKKFGKDGAKLASLSLKDFNNICYGIFEKVKKSRRSGQSQLKIYSPWLSRFKGDIYLLKLEVPGQYQGKGKPMPDYHVKIAGFDPRVRIMQSMRKPKRVTILGDDGKEYMYLVKGGEDLRLDQRIEQLFKIMNGILFADPGCCQRRLSLRTYEVIPMSNRMGIIEWMDNTVPLKDFLESAMEPTELQNKESPKFQFKKWLEKFGSSQPVNVQYKAMYKKAKRDEVKRVFESVQAAVPFDLLKRGFLNMVASPEAFLAIRSLFVRSHACLSICNYVLGIGDRHLSNFMIDQRTGGMIGIDFGHAFGSATHILPLPELMPFRLTRQFISLLQPLKEEGQMRNSMIATMRALSNDSYVLLNTADVFIKEPLLDWKSAARRHEQQGNVDKRMSRDESWFPRQKISQLRKKLNRYNPSHVTRDDLKLGHGRSDEFKDLEKILLGERQYNTRARVDPQCRDVEEQVACLVDQATDPNILGRTWMGWEPWM